MKIFNPQEHLSCLYYGCGSKAAIEIRSFDRGHSKTLPLEKNKIICVLEGELKFKYREQPVKHVAKGRFFFIPSGGKFTFTATRDTRVMVIRIQKNVFLCEGCSIEQLYKEKIGSDDPLTHPAEGVTTLEMNRPLWRFAEELEESMGAGLNCKYYHDLKIKEILIFIRAYYSREDLRELFSTVLSPDTQFSEFVRANHTVLKTVGELAAACHMTPQTFAKKFTRVFGTTPGQWLKKEKAKEIYAALYAGKKSIVEIADEYGFSAQPQFNRFCKVQWGKTPGEIRREKINKQKANTNRE